VEYTNFQWKDVVVLEAVDGVDALDKAIKNQPNLILLDSNMPIMDGYETAQRLRENPDTQAIPIIAISGETAPYDRPMSEFCDLVIQKPFDLMTLMKMIETYLGAVE
jgi:CheY-like chemotaxis protein